MIKQALQYIVGMSQPNTQIIDGAVYSDKNLVRINHNPKAEPITLKSLNSLSDYLRSGYDKHDNLFVHVVDYDNVRVYSALDDERVRENVIRVNAEIPQFRFDEFIQHEKFCIALQTKFVKNADRELLLKFAGTVESGSVAEYGDDGVTQKATVKTGIASKTDAIVPNPVNLIAYRTFIEVDQPETQYVFRMKQERDEVYCGIFEADGGAWKNMARKNVRAYLEKILSDIPDITILS